jgi:cyclopropane-fatty-acyl-phospholipid synthase
MNELALEFRRAPALDTSHFPAQVKLAVSLLERLQHGRLDIVFPDGQRAHYGNPRSEERADLQLVNWNVVGAALKSGDIGFAESYIAGDWATSDLAQLLSFFVHNREAAEKMFYGTMIGRVAYRLRHLLNRNTRSRAKKNIHAHYDLGNEFYKLWLDPTMTYSSAWLDGAAGGAHVPLSDHEFALGQQAKYRRVLDQLALPPAARVLELGCGWGGFTEAAGAAGHKVTALTLSLEQLAHARARLQARDLAADLRLQDYRDENGCYDGIASIEMFEAVGEAYWPSYFAALRRCLAPGGRACVQTIVIADQLFARYRVGTDFIQQYVFPGGMLPSPTVFKAQAASAGLKVVDEHAFGRDYARTLATWSQRFMARLDDVRALGFDDRFIRIWQFYLAYCEAAFARKNTDVVQYTLVHA